MKMTENRKVDFQHYSIVIVVVVEFNHQVILATIQDDCYHHKDEVATQGWQERYFCDNFYRNWAALCSSKCGLHRVGQPEPTDGKERRETKMWRSHRDLQQMHFAFKSHGPWGKDKEFLILSGELNSVPEHTSTKPWKSVGKSKIRIAN